MESKQVIVGVTGGIAAYKAAELVRLLVKSEIRTRVAMTRHATRFVTPLTFETLCGNPVIHDMWEGEGTAMAHIDWGQEADLIIIAPATANFVAKMAHGIGDDFLSTMLLAATARVMVCPSMNTHMYENRAVQANLALLRDRGIVVMDPGKGQLACRTEGPGRLPEPVEILDRAAALLSPQDLSGLTILVTAGPTVEPIDPVRFVSNRSSGKMGYALADAARKRGAAVILVSGPTNLTPPTGVEHIGVKSAEDMRTAVLDRRKNCHIIIKAAAVADYRPRQSRDQKIKKGPEGVSLELVKNPDILAELGASRHDYPGVLVGFAAETEDLLENATEKVRAKNLDMIVANDVTRTDAGFDSDTNKVKIITKDGAVEDVPLMPKGKVADLVLDRSKAILDKNFE
ncbi:MAG: bifunctional phosphopantothenoylcysteine decarboxylase/phosphopantothenate--cysteine ligase CoaBC [Deltaproteobacteria bacterium]|nr:bifunctional phosphopantothenoylcysteine decarboxylase/phosphopantothenate--cysteine ligase CoaBC [Deltaproteobacteria bacterium]